MNDPLDPYQQSEPRPLLAPAIAEAIRGRLPARDPARWPAASSDEARRVLEEIPEPDVSLTRWQPKNVRRAVEVGFWVCVAALVRVATAQPSTLGMAVLLGLAAAAILLRAPRWLQRRRFALIAAAGRGWPSSDQAQAFDALARRVARTAPAFRASVASASALCWTVTGRPDRALPIDAAIWKLLPPARRDDVSRERLGYALTLEGHAGAALWLASQEPERPEGYTSIPAIYVALALARAGAFRPAVVECERIRERLVRRQAWAVELVVNVLEAYCIAQLPAGDRLRRFEAHLVASVAKFPPMAFEHIALKWPEFADYCEKHGFVGEAVRQLRVES